MRKISVFKKLLHYEQIIFKHNEYFKDLKILTFKNLYNIIWIFLNKVSIHIIIDIIID